MAVTTAAAPNEIDEFMNGALITWVCSFSITFYSSDIFPFIGLFICLGISLPFFRLMRILLMYMGYFKNTFKITYFMKNELFSP